MRGNLDRWGPIEVVAPAAWLAALRDPAHPIERAAAFLGNVTGDWTTSPRVAPEYAVHYCFGAPRAALEVQLEDRRFELPAGSMVWLPPGVPYELAMHSRRRREDLVRLRFQLWRDGRILSPFERPWVVPDVLRVRALAERLRAEWLVERPHRDAEVRHLLGEVSVLALRADAARPRGRLSPPQVARLAAWVAERVERRPDPAELAAVLELSPTHFARVFKATLGCPPRSWLVRERIRHAAERLRERDVPVAQVAAEFGYDNPFLFSRQFSAVMGCSPSAWRGGGGSS